MGIETCGHVTHVLWETSFALSSAVQLVAAATFLAGSGGVLVAQLVLQGMALAFLAAWETAFVVRTAQTTAEEAWFLAWGFLFILTNIMAVVNASDELSHGEPARGNVQLQLGAQLASFVPLVVFRWLRHTRLDYQPVVEQAA
jgi:hypothetical protein